jgi:RP/EB family microtubule-associated protein
VKLDQVKWAAKSEYEYTINYNLVQKAMKGLHIGKAIPAEALMKGKPLDNIEFCQWLKHYYCNVSVVEDYDGFAEREAVAPGIGKKAKKWAAGGDSGAAPAAKKPAATRARPLASNQTRPSSRATGGGASSAASSEAVAKLQEEVASQKQEISDLNLNVDALTKERDFYFGKLRDVEIMIQESESEEGLDEAALNVFESIKAILYATDETAEGGDDEEY